MIRLVSAFHLSASAPYLIWKLLILSLAISPKTAYQHLPKNRVGRLPCRGFFTLPILQGIVAASTHTHRDTPGELWRETVNVISAEIGSVSDMNIAMYVIHLYEIYV